MAGLLRDRPRHRCSGTSIRSVHPSLRSARLQSQSPRDGRCRAGEVLIEPAEDSKFGKGLIVEFRRPKRMRHGPCCFGNDGGVPGVGFLLAGVQASDPARSRDRQIVQTL